VTGITGAGAHESPQSSRIVIADTTTIPNT
jgi:hypothetical protein